MIDRKIFFDGIRAHPFDGNLTDGQVSGVSAILDEWERRALLDKRWLAYMLATVKWETANTMQPIREMGSAAYLRSKPYWPWTGRGYVQLTWKTNYQKFHDRVLKQFNADIIVSMDLAMQPPIAAFIMFEGMLNGEFTGRKLADFFNPSTTDWYNARRIINGLDKAQQIAALGHEFNAVLIAAA